MLRLRIIDEDGYEVVVPLVRDEISIGRREGNTIRLTERNISRHHALLTRENGQLFVDDLDSYNGIILNGNRISRKSGLYEGDILEIGDYKIRLEPADQTLGRVEIDPGTLDEVRRFMREQEEGFEGPEVVAELLDEVRPSPAPPKPKPARPPAASSLTPPPAPKPPEPGSRPQPPELLHTAATVMLPAVTDDEIEPPPIPEPEPVEEAASSLTQMLPAVDLDQPPEPPAGRAVTDVRLSLTPVPEPRPADTSGRYDVVVDARSSDGLDFEDSQRRRTRRLIGIAASLVILGIVLIAVFAGGPETESPPSVEDPEPELVALPPGTKVPSPELEEALRRDIEMAAERERVLREAAVVEGLAEVRRLMGEESWAEAERTLNALLEQLPETEEARVLRETVRLEKAAHSDFTKGLKALDRKENYLAVLLFSGIAPESVYHARAREYLPTAQARLVRQYVAEGWTAHNRGDQATALRQAEKALAIASDDAEARRLQRAADAKAKLPAAQVAKAPESPPLDAPRHYNIAIDFFKKKQYPKAVQHFKEALRLDPRFTHAWRGLAVCHATTGQTDDAMRAYERYLALDPKGPEADQVRKILEDYRASKR